MMSVMSAMTMSLHGPHSTPTPRGSPMTLGPPEDYKDDGGLSEFEETPWDKYECWSSKERRHFDRKNDSERFVAEQGHAGPVEQRLRRTYRAFLKEDKKIFLAEAKAREGRKGKRATTEVGL